MKIKKILAIVLAAALCLCVFAACGNDEGTGTETGKVNSSDSSKSTDASENSDASKNANGSDDVSTTVTGTFKLGVIGPLTGEAAIYGNAVANGAKIAVDEINALGGDIQFELNAQDDEADGEKAVNAYNNLLDWGMQVLVGPTTTGSAISVSSEVNKDRVFAITPSASSLDVIDGKDNMFQVCFTDPNQGTASADYISENLKDSKIAIIYRNDDAYSQGIHDKFVEEANAKGLEIVADKSFTKDSATDFSTQLTAAQSAGATVVFLPIYYQPASVILKQADSMGYKPTFFGVDGMDGILTMKEFDANLAEGVMLLTPFVADATDDKTVSFVSMYKGTYGDTPNQFAADAYDAVYVVYEAIKMAGCTSDMSAADICEKLVEVMPNITFDGLTGEAMTWEATGEVSKAPKAMVIKNGVYVSPDAE